MVPVTKSIARAMAEQVSRVNRRDEVPVMRHQPPGDSPIMTPAEYELRQQVQQLTTELARARAIIARLEERLNPQPLASAPLRLNDEPVITPKEAAERAGVSVATVSRYLMTGWWRGRQEANGRWLVFANQDLVPKGRGKRR